MGDNNRRSWLTIQVLLIQTPDGERWRIGAPPRERVRGGLMAALLFAALLPVALLAAAVVAA